MRPRHLLPGLALLLLGALLLFRCTPNDTVKPSVQFIRPADGDTFPPGIYTISAQASDDQELDFVVFWAYDEMLSLLHQPARGDTYEADVDCRGVTDTPVQLAVEAVDKAVNITRQSLTIFITH
jgi:hypothetical protein